MSNNRVDVTCMTCGKVFSLPPSRIRAMNTRKNKTCYCSKVCADNTKRVASTVACDICGKTFKLVPSRIRARQRNTNTTGKNYGLNAVMGV